MCAASDIRTCTDAAGTPGADGIILRGTVILPDSLLCSGDVLVSRSTNKILCVGADCTSDPGATGAPVICGDVVSPGLINGHDHLQYNHLPRFQHPSLFVNHDDWTGDSGYRAFSKAFVGSSGAETCDSMKYSEVRMLMAGTTSVDGTVSNRCIDGMVRDLDTPYNGLGLDADYVTFIDSANFAKIRGDLASGTPAAIHVDEGLDLATRDPQFKELVSEGLVSSHTAVIHATALSTDEFRMLAQGGASILWSPRSNIDLYGLTTNVVAAKNAGVPISIGTDWTPSGSLNLLDEVRCADFLNTSYYDRAFTDRDLFDAVTLTPARALGVDQQIGSLAVGLKGDVTLFRGDRTRPLRAVIDAQNDDVELVLVDGNGAYGDADKMSGIEPNAFCEDVDVCTRARRVCVQSAAAGDPDQHDRTLATITTNLTNALATSKASCTSSNCYAYDLMPLFECTPVDPSVCTPSRGAVTGVKSREDSDGDGVPDATDLCPNVFDPPFLGCGAQDDADGDGIGDSCDPCPFQKGTSCAAAKTGDLDGDGVPDASDKCPLVADDQADGDGDGIGDACDPCPGDPDTTCATIHALRDWSDPTHRPTGLVTLHDVTVTAVSATAQGLWVEEAGTGYAGIFVYFGTTALPAALPGQGVDVSGTYVEFTGESEIANPTVTVVDPNGNEMAPQPLADPAAVGSCYTAAEPLEGMLVELDAVSVTDPNPDAPSNFDEYEASGLRVDDLILDGVNDGSPAYAAGTSFTSITGILEFLHGNYKVEPRGASDVVP
jgi:cytosine/adenosine deaminase-related metal-dependent hydrolase